MNNRNAVLFTVATKSELLQHKAVMKYEEELMAKEFNAHHYELSAAQDGGSVKHMFQSLARKMLESRIRMERQVNLSPTSMMIRKLLNKYEKKSGDYLS